MIKKLARDLRLRLFKEHLGENAAVEDFNDAFRLFREISHKNFVSLEQGLLMCGRPVSMAPADLYARLLKRVYATSRTTRVLTKLGLNPSDVAQIYSTSKDKAVDLVKHTSQKARL